MGSGFFSQDNPPPAEQSPAGPGPGNVVVQEPTGVDGATASFFGRGAAPALQAFEEDAKAAAGEAAASAAAAAASAVASAASAGEALNVATGIDAYVDQAEAAKNAAQASATNSANSATAAAGSASASNTSATQASTSATNAGNSATAAATSATNSATSAASAVSSASQAASSANSVNAAATTATAKAAEATASATNAANSATSASTSASTATTKAAEAATSASAAAGSVTTAGASATAAGTSATNAANSASAAGTSATNAAASAATATTKASESSTSATNAASSATSAAGSATTATTKASEASASATNAAASATTATTKASEASTSATNAANSATAAGTSATNAANSASAAGTSATNAANSATNAANSATAAAGSATAAAGSAANASSAQSAAESARDATLAAFDSFDDRYLGTKTSNPTVDNDGNALVAGALYFNSTAGEMRVWTGSVWTAAYVSGAGVLLQANNLSDLASASTARTNIGLGNVENKSSATIRGEITSSNVTTALGYTPYNSSNPSGYISGITSGNVTTALGYTPYNATNPAGYISSITSGNVTTALGYTPANKAGDTFTGPVYVNNGSHQAIVNSDGNLEITRSGGGAYIDLKDSTGEDYDVRLQASGNVLGIAAPGGMTLNGAAVLTGITSGQVTTALGYTPYNSSNPSGYITSAALSPYALLSGAAFTGNVTTTGDVGIGTATPEGKLDINGSQVVRGDSNGFAFFAPKFGTTPFGANYDRFEIRVDTGSQLTLLGNTHGGTGAARALAFVNGNNERMRIDTAGNVGIGTSAPQAKLDVVGVSLLRVAASGGAQPLVVRNDSTASNTTKTTSLVFQGVDTVGTSKNTGLVQCGPSDVNYVTSYLAFQTRSGDVLTERARITAGGELLVGTTTGGRAVCINAADNWIRQSNPSRSWLIGQGVGTGYTIYDETAGAARFAIDTAGVWNGPNSIVLGQGQNFDNRVEIGAGRTGSNFAYIDLIGDTTYTDYGLRLLRGNAGPNATSELLHRGTGDFVVGTVDAGVLRFSTNNTERMRFDSAGTASFLGLLTGRSSAATDVNTANDTGSFSVRGTSTTIASMSFHRTGAYAINMGLGTDNVFRIGGWSASSNAFQMDGSGNLTMLGNVTAYSDARIKKDVETIDSALDLVSKMRGVRYTRIDNDKRGVGVIAQEMLAVLPEVVQQGVGDDDTLSVAYGNLVGVLIEAIKELKAEVETLKEKNQ